MKYTDGYIFSNPEDRELLDLPHAVTMERSGELLERLLRAMDRLNREIDRRLGSTAAMAYLEPLDREDLTIHEQAWRCRVSVLKLVEFGAAASIADEAEAWLTQISE